MPQQLAKVEHIFRTIRVRRGHKVLLETELAELYGIATKALLQAVRRNPKRFPEDFMFQLTAEEWDASRSRLVKSKAQRGARRSLPHVFTEQGVAMLGSVLHGDRAIVITIQILRVFARVRALTVPRPLHPPIPRRQPIGFAPDLGEMP